MPTLPLEKLLSGMVELVEELEFVTKRQIIRTVVNKIVATKKEANIWGYLPVLDARKIVLDVKYRHCRAAERRKIDFV